MWSEWPGQGEGCCECVRCTSEQPTLYYTGANALVTPPQFLYRTNPSSWASPARLLMPGALPSARAPVTCSVSAPSRDALLACLSSPDRVGWVGLLETSAAGLDERYETVFSFLTFIEHQGASHGELYQPSPQRYETVYLIKWSSTRRRYPLVDNTTGLVPRPPPPSKAPMTARDAAGMDCGGAGGGGTGGWMTAGAYTCSLQSST